MTRQPSKAYYVTARHDRRTAWLCGPFLTHQAALQMVEAVRRAANLTDDPRFAFSAFGTASLPWANAKPGTLPLKLLAHPDVIDWVITPIAHRSYR